MNFWAAIQLQHRPGEELTDVQEFQKSLQEAWYRDVEQRSGRIVRQFTRDSAGTLIQSSAERANVT
jgi:predicted AAA+ superfamily ATPase